MIKKMLILLMALAALTAGMSAALADAMTLSVYFCGQIPREDGGVDTLPLEGTFRVFQGGVELGEIAVGETLLVTGTEGVRLEPLPETIEPAWDLTGAVTEVAMTDGTHVTVPVVVQPWPAEEPEVEVPPAEEPEAEPEVEPEADFIYRG